MQASHEPCLFPSNLLDHPNGERENRQWWVVYTKARHEKALARDSLHREVPFFLPLFAQTNQSRGRRYKVQVPLFPGYVFLLASDEERVWTLTTNHVSRFLSVADPDSFEQDLGHLYRLLSSNALVTPEKQLEPGRRVRVRSGPLFGIEGRVLSRHGESRLLVAVDFLQQGASMQIDDFMVEPIE